MILFCCFIQRYLHFAVFHLTAFYLAVFIILFIVLQIGITFARDSGRSPADIQCNLFCRFAACFCELTNKKNKIAKQADPPTAIHSQGRTI